MLVYVCMHACMCVRMYVCTCIRVCRHCCCIFIRDSRTAYHKPPQLFRVRARLCVCVCVCILSTCWIRTLRICSISRKTDCYLFVYKLTVNFYVRTEADYGVLCCEASSCERHSHSDEVLVIQAHIIWLEGSLNEVPLCCNTGLEMELDPCSNN